MPGPKLKTVTRTQGNNRALKDGTVKPKTFEFDFVEVDPLIAAFRRMVRGAEFDICEMAITTYICAKAHGKPMTAVPVFIVRAFHHGAILVNTKAGIGTPKDLEGKRVGVNRGYTVTTGRVGAQHPAGGAWRRPFQDHLGAVRRRACRRIQATGQCHPDRAGQEDGGHARLGRACRRDRGRREIAGREAAHSERAGSRSRGTEQSRPLSDQPYGRDQGRADRRHPDLAADVFNAFAEAKRLYVERLKADKIEKPTEVDEVHRRVMAITGDPLPYGIVPNRKVIDELIGHAVTQGIITKPVTADELFAPSTHSLAG